MTTSTYDAMAPSMAPKPDLPDRDSDAAALEQSASSSATTATAGDAMAHQPKAGPPAGNINRAKTGAKLRRPLPIGSLPKALRRAVEEPTRRYRRLLELLTMQARGVAIVKDEQGRVINEPTDISPSDHHAIDLCVSHFTHAAVCRWLMANRFDSMTAAEIQANSREQVAAKEARNKLLARLKLDIAADDPADPWAQFDAQRAADLNNGATMISESSPPSTPANASEKPTTR